MAEGDIQWPTEKIRKGKQWSPKDYIICQISVEK